MTSIEIKNNPVAKLVFDVLSERQRHRQRTDLNNLYRGMLKIDSGLDHDKFMDVFRSLDQNGAGKLVRGRRGNPDRFIWKYDLRALAEAAKRNGINPATMEQLELQQPDKVIPAKVRRKARRPAKRKVIQHVQMKAKAQVASPVKGEQASEPQTIIQISLKDMSQSDRVALIKLLTNK